VATQPGDPPDANNNNDDGYDQIQVANNASLNGKLQVVLVNNYLPAIGTEFDFLTVGSNLSGSFTDAEGLYSFPEGDRYFRLVEVQGGLKLVVTATPGNLRINPAADSRDDFGEFLNGDYFHHLTFSGNATLNVQDFASLSGTFAFSKTTGKITAAGSNITAFAGSGSTGVQVDNAKLGVVILTPTSGSSTYALEGTGTASLVGVPDLSLSGSLSVAVNTTGQAIDETLSTPGGSVQVKFDNGDAVQQLEGSVQLRISNFADFSGTILATKQVAGTTTTISVIANNVNGFLGNGAATADPTDDIGVQLSNGLFGLKLLKDSATNQSTYAIAASGQASLVGVDGLTLAGVLFAKRNTGMDDVSFDYGTADTADDVTVSAGISQFGGSAVLSIAGFVELSGSFSFEKTAKTINGIESTRIEVAANNVEAFLGTGSGTQSATRCEVD
jgi:hypothetical protein